ncbi:MAG: chemotaxis-specific protein-glutamate methyltransferase CheB, partial [Bacteriovorax sp.]
EVVAMAERPSEVEPLILKHKPDVITLDIHMPEMDGVTLLKQIAPKFHVPTVMISSISMAEGPLVLEALEHGAVDYIQKPELSEIERVTPLILDKVKTAAMANISKASRNKKTGPVKTDVQCDLSSLIVLGSSTGGTEAIREIITALPNQIPPMLIVQHIPAVFSKAFANRMNDLCPFEVKEAENGDEVRANRVLIAPGGTQMKLIMRNGNPYVEINDDEPVNRFKPSVDYMFLSVAKNLYTHTTAVILTGMGKDGAKGMLELKKLGVRTIAQDEYTSVVFGMPKEAIALGAAEFVEPLSEIAERVATLSKEKSSFKKIG